MRLSAIFAFLCILLSGVVDAADVLTACLRAAVAVVKFPGDYGLFNEI